MILDNKFSIISWIVGGAISFYVYILNNQIDAYKNTAIQNKEEIARNIEAIKEINQKIKNIDSGKECECLSYDNVLKEHTEKLKLLYDTCINNTNID